MCGIAGIINAPLRDEELRRRLSAMQQSLRHRGPDDQGLHLAAAKGTGFAHTRLAILDLSPAGHQPMTSDDGRYTIVFNGEIYNFLELRDELIQQGVTFRSRCDTEVILRLFEARGEACLSQLNGMFAFAIWDHCEHTCFMARDPLGIKPLYYWEHQGALAFASEMRSLLQADLTSRELCPYALYQYLLYGSVQEPQTLVRGIRLLPAGHSLIWKQGACETKAFWALRFTPDPETNGDAVERTRIALQDSVRRHLVSDVPVGLFLSGGMDSTAIAALATSIGVRNLQTFCISFDEEDFSEGETAARTAAHFGTLHRECRMTSKDGQALLSDFLASIDQPSNDGFNTYCVSKVAHAHGLKVVLSGIGGDEIFGGYHTFARIPRMMTWHRRLAVVGPLRGFAGRLSERHAGSYRLRRLGAFLASPGRVPDAYWTMRGFFTPVEAKRLVNHYLGHEQEPTLGNGLEPEWHEQPTMHDQIGYLEMTRYMRNQLLRDSDVMSMAWGLELRVPLVDEKVVETVGGVPAAVRCEAGKDLLQRAVPEIPAWVANQPKRGFRFPFDRWVREQWSDTFREIEKASPVPLQTWYRAWCLFTLNHFLSANQINAGLCIGGSV